MGSIDRSIDHEEDGAAPELTNRLGLALCIVSDNARTHARRSVRVARAVSASRLFQSSSAPALQSKAISRWTGGDQSQSSHRKPSEKDNTGSGGLKIPSRTRLTVQNSPGCSSTNSSWEKGSKNATWDFQTPSSKLHGLGSDKSRLKSLGLGGFRSNMKKAEKNKRVESLRPSAISESRWSMPKRSSDSSLIYPQRHGDT